MLDRSGMLHNVERCDIERLEQAADNSSNSLETFVERQQVHFWQLVGVSRHIHLAGSRTISKFYNRNGNIVCKTQVI